MAVARLSGRPGGSGEDDTETDPGHAVAAPDRESALLDELSQLKYAAAPITPIGLSGGECSPAAARLRLLSPPKPMKPAAASPERILTHSATSSCIGKSISLSTKGGIGTSVHEDSW